MPFTLNKCPRRSNPNPTAGASAAGGRTTRLDITTLVREGRLHRGSLTCATLCKYSCHTQKVPMFCHMSSRYYYAVFSSFSKIDVLYLVACLSAFLLSHLYKQGGLHLCLKVIISSTAVHILVVGAGLMVEHVDVNLHPPHTVWRYCI